MLCDAHQKKKKKRKRNAVVAQPLFARLFPKLRLRLIKKKKVYNPGSSKCAPGAVRVSFLNELIST